MIKSICTLDIGGLLATDRVEGLIAALRSAGATYLLCERTMISMGSISTDDLLRPIETRKFSFIFQNDQGHKMPGHLKLSLEETALDYRWSWEGFYQTDPGMICVDAARHQEAQFLAIGKRIVLETDELTNSSRIEAAKHWATWHPRPLIIYASNHELLQAHAALR